MFREVYIKGDCNSNAATLSLPKEIPLFFSFLKLLPTRPFLCLKFGHQECGPYSSNLAKNWYERLADRQKHNFLPLRFQLSPAVTISFSRPYRPTV